MLNQNPKKRGTRNIVYIFKSINFKIFNNYFFCRDSEKRGSREGTWGKRNGVSISIIKIL